MSEVKVGDKVRIKRKSWFMTYCKTQRQDSILYHAFCMEGDHISIPVCHRVYDKDAVLLECTKDNIGPIYLARIDGQTGTYCLRRWMFDTDEDIENYNNRVVDESIKEQTHEGEVLVDGMWVKTEDVNKELHSSGVKHDDKKLRWSLLPWDQMETVVKVLEYGAKKYAPDNWKKISNGRHRYTDAAVRHLVACLQGEWNDSEDNLPHLAHVVCCCLFAMWHNKKEWDDHDKKMEGK